MTSPHKLLLTSLLAAMHVTTLHADWEPTAPLPEPNGGFMAGVVAGKIIVAGGTNWKEGTKQWLDKVHVYDPATNRWTHGPALPHPIAYAAFASDGTRLYMAGGADGTQGRREVHALDADLKLTKVGELAKPTVFAGGALLNDRLCLIGGTPNPDDWSKAVSGLYTVDLQTGTPSTAVPITGLTHGLGIPAVTVAGGRLFSFTGAWLDSGSNEVRNMADTFVHDFAKGSWNAAAPYPQAVRGLAAVALDDNQIYLAGGYGKDAEGFLNKAFVYEVKADRHLPAKTLPFTAATCLVLCDGFVYALGGEDEKKHRTAQCWRIRTTELR